MGSRTSIPRREFIGRMSAVGAMGIAGVMLESSALAKILMGGTDGVNLATVTLADFDQHLSEKFRIYPKPGRPIELELLEVRDEGRGRNYPAGFRRPFSLLFRGPQGALLDQRTYPTKHARLGRFEMFYFPLGAFQDGVRLAVVFN